MFVHSYSARARGLCTCERVSAHSPALCMDRYLWRVFVTLGHTGCARVSLLTHPQ